MKEKHEIEKINWGVIPLANYRGFVLTRLIGGYEIMGHKVKTPQEVDKVIEQAYSSLEKSIDR
jgi:hypothetical protein